MAKVRRPMETQDKHLWIWEWIGGGYNSCRAATREEAIARAHEMCRYAKVLKIDESTLHVGTPDELRHLDRIYGY
jgi:hypothetical protein